jgi:hypothetical protein
LDLGVPKFIECVEMFLEGAAGFFDFPFGNERPEQFNGRDQPPRLNPGLMDRFLRETLLAAPQPFAIPLPTRMERMSKVPEHVGRFVVWSCFFRRWFHMSMRVSSGVGPD